MKNPHIHIRALIGLIIALPSVLYFSAWIAARDFEERLMWDGIPPVALIEHFHQVSNVPWLVLGCGVLGLTLLFLGSVSWQIVGIFIPIIGMMAVYQIFNGLKDALAPHGEHLVHGNELLNGTTVMAMAGLLLLSMMLAVVIRWLIPFYQQQRRGMWRRASARRNNTFRLASAGRMPGAT